MMKKGIKVAFSKRREIRMGSPYMFADLKIKGLEIDLPKTDWQDKFAISKDNKWLVLINFDLSDNEPGFVFYIIDIEHETVKRTERLMGLVNEVHIENGIIKFNRFQLDRSKSRPGELCCNNDSEWPIT